MSTAPLNKPKLTKGRIVAAFAISVVADIVQLPVTAAEATGVLAVPGELADFVIDSIVMVAISGLIGFHWMLLPTFVVELVPGLELLPTWTGCVAYVVWRRKQEQRGTVIDVQTVPPVIEIPAQMTDKKSLPPVVVDEGGPKPAA